MRKLANRNPERENKYMIYKIQWAKEIKSGNKNGRPWQITEMTLEDEQGNVTEKVSTFDSVMSGGTIEGTIAKGKYGLEFKKLEAPNFIKEQRGNYKTQQMEKVMERKEQGIAKSQDNKEWSIKVSSTMRDAVLLSIAEGKPEAERILAWRKWLWNNFDVSLSDTDAITGMLN